MEITLTRKSTRGNGTSYSNIDIYKFLEGIKSGQYGEYLQNFRDTRDGIKREEDYRYFDRMYKVIPACKWVKRPQNGLKFEKYTGIIALKVTNTTNKVARDKIKAEATQLPQTLATFVGADGQSVVILTQA